MGAHFFVVERLFSIVPKASFINIRDNVIHLISFVIDIS